MWKLFIETFLICEKSNLIKFDQVWSILDRSDRKKSKIKFHFQVWNNISIYNYEKGEKNTKKTRCNNRSETKVITRRRACALLALKNNRNLKKQLISMISLWPIFYLLSLMFQLIWHNRFNSLNMYLAILVSWNLWRWRL